VLCGLLVPLSDDEREGLQHSGRTLRAVLDKPGLDRWVF
jgi:hypothetical protein